ncbi:putative calcium-binding protein CML15, partial [Cucurbita argyrosperma subsp. argyrosperma]
MGNSKSKTYKRVLVPVSEEQLLDIFKSHDRDGDGKLSKEELKQAFSYLGSRFSAFRAEEALRTVDDNHDGVVSMDEMNKLIQYTKGRKYTIC